MHIILAVLTLVAAAMTTVAAVSGSGSGPGDPASAHGLKASLLHLDLRSFLFGFIAGMAALWLARVEWAAIPQAILATLRTWRRNVIFFGLAVASAGVLLFY